MDRWRPFNSEDCIEDGLHVRADKIPEEQWGPDKQLHQPDQRGFTEYGQLQLRVDVEPDVAVQHQYGWHDDK